MKKINLCSPIISTLLLSICLLNCGNDTQKRVPSDLDGEKLAKIRCASCHAYPSPDLLDKTTWEKYVLPRMGYFFGIYSASEPRTTLIESNHGGTVVKQADIFPMESTISQKEWRAIQDFYRQNAPNKLLVPTKTIAKSHPLFEMQKPNYQLSPPATTFIGLGQNSTILLGDANKKALLLFDQQLELQNIAKLAEGIVDVKETSNSFLITIMGSFSPTDNPGGKIYALQKNGQVRVLIDSLQRPVQSQFTDLDQDGLMDIVVAEFGKWTGGLFWYKNLQNMGFKKQTLRGKSGAINAHIVDFNQDNLPDILGLFGQGDEGIFLYENQGKGQFKEIRLLTFPPSYGSSFCSLFDFNQDGQLDILYTAGDNADYPAITKPYHGIRIFENKGNYQFEETFFYHLNGAYKAIPSDLDQDGDIDLAAISFFPDYENAPEEGFVFLENQGNFVMKAHSFPAVESGRWLVMEASDLEGDGDLDIFLGSLTMEVRNKPHLVEQWVKEGLPFLVLENQIK